MTSAFITRPQAQDYHRDARDIVSVDVISGLAIWGSAFLESYAGNRARIDDERDVKRGLCKYPGSWRDYLEKLGVVGRDTSKHPWGE